MDLKITTNPNDNSKYYNATLNASNLDVIWKQPNPNNMYETITFNQATVLFKIMISTNVGRWSKAF
jgi:hypothetical protein